MTFHLPIHDLSLPCTWAFTCLYMSFHFPAHDLSLAYTWLFTCLHLTFHLPIHDISLVYWWPFLCLYMNFHLPIHDLSLDYTWLLDHTFSILPFTTLIKVTDHIRLLNFHHDINILEWTTVMIWSCLLVSARFFSFNQRCIIPRTKSNWDVLVLWVVNQTN